ncbi:flagellar basal body-associated protein FliL [Streptococcus gallinaceus]|uniref:hypothetical protein n=1 Tax=Streptococcus gallinaceus TaxID=165758 RepID=UPI00209D4775|nr:hypothetical protein [Streptococcus gallinaceus]MCP1640387.1 flagellar basal body-associated protein FliL [Streptococcus gallinaceus]MCP1771170.1 flagellar basal body-associated protein FliL [Streptococcus gallinaceus]
MMENMENEVTQELAKKKSPLKWILGILAAVVICIGAGTAFWYNSGDISGTWRSPSLEKELMTTLTKETGDFSEIGLKPTDLFKDPQVTLAVKDKKVTITVAYKVDSTAFGTAYTKMVEKEYQKILAEAEKTASQYNVSKEEVLKQGYGAEYEKTIKALFPTEEKAIEEFNKSILQNAEKEGAKFDSKTGMVTASEAAGQVNQLLHIISGSSDGKKVGLENFSFSKYNRSGDKLTFEGKKEYKFVLDK